MGMDSKKLSARTKQPGHDRTYTVSETNFIAVATAVLDPQLYVVVDHPADLRKLFANELGVVPEASIASRITGRKFFVEVKKQGPAGNADERACKHHTTQFYRTLQTRFPDYTYHPFVTVFCENLAADRRYTLKAEHLFEPDHYFLWVDYDSDRLKAYLTARCRAWLD